MWYLKLCVFFRIVLAIWGLLCFHTHLRIFFVCFISLKNAIKMLVGIALNLYIALCHMSILTMLILPIHEQSISFHFFVSSSISFNHVLCFSIYRYFASLLCLCLDVLFFFVGTVNGIGFSDILLLLGRNAIDFSVLILSPTNLLFIVSNRLLMESSGFFFDIWNHSNCK